MAGLGKIPGRYNIIIKNEYETFDHQMPVVEFIQRLTNDDVPDTVTVVGLGQAFVDGDILDELAHAMEQRANDLEFQSPTVQFVVDGSFHRHGKMYDLRYNDELYSLQNVFGPQLDRKEQGNWLVVPF